MKSFKSYLLKEDIKDILLSDYKNKEMLLTTKMQRKQHLQEIQKQDLLVQMQVLKMTNCSP